VLQDPQNTLFVEFGAGKGYLSCMLAESMGVGGLVLVDQSGFRLTADR
jgi:16S rRNA G1207 methylase RsmC